MYLLASSTARITCPGPTAFAYAADLENFAAWFPGVIAVAANDELPFWTVGKLYSETVAVPLRGTRGVQIRVIVVDSPRRLITEGDLPVLLPRMEIEVRDIGAGCCEVHWRMFSRNENALICRCVLPLAGRVMRRRAGIGLRNLTAKLEAPQDDRS
ncbi:hypothetical protein BH09ACT8_BH09ACT8_21370 [soil metagenome]